MKKIDIEELYWSDLDQLEEDVESLEEILTYLKDYHNRSIEEVSQIVKLYSNPSGTLTIEFANIVADFYREDKIKFMKALKLAHEEIGNLVYVFRNLKVFEDEDRELEEVLKTKELSSEEIATAEDFFKMYKKICTS